MCSVIIQYNLESSFLLTTIMGKTRHVVKVKKKANCVNHFWFLWTGLVVYENSKSSILLVFLKMASRTITFVERSSRANLSPIQGLYRCIARKRADTEHKHPGHKLLDFYLHDGTKSASLFFNQICIQKKYRLLYRYYHV